MHSKVIKIVAPWSYSLGISCVKISKEFYFILLVVNCLKLLCCQTMVFGPLGVNKMIYYNNNIQI